MIQASHVVILGAGASLAAFPNGDKNGRKLPLMNSLADALELSKIIPAKYNALLDNFEKLYSTIHCDEKETKLKLKIDDMVYQYFYEMEIPEAPTLYDYLVLSLRENDVIATFNWDPLLLQCMRRHAEIGHLPKVHFLHGNVAVGFCKNCNLSGYNYNLVCHRCSNTFVPMKLLYPIEKKDYSSDITIREEWNSLEYYLQHALYVTIFGYSAPDSDIDAKNLMLDSFVKNKSRQLGQLEFIDIKKKMT